jgi:hypothetical protein
MKRIKWIGKSLDHPQLWGGLFNPQTMKRSNLPPKLSKTVYFIPWDSFIRRFATVTIASATVAESLKNHSKSQKNHKMKNLILLDFT